MTKDKVKQAEKYGRILGKAIYKIIKDDNTEVWAFLYGIWNEIFDFKNPKPHETIKDGK